MSIFRNMCLKIANFHNLSKNRQIHVINRCQLTVLMPLFSDRIKEQLLYFDDQRTKMEVLFLFLGNMLLNIDIISNAIFYSPDQSYSRNNQIDNVDIINASSKLFHS